MTFSIAVAAAAFVLIFPVEFPDKTFVATLVLATRFRPLLVWIGVASAFLVQTIVAVVAIVVLLRWLVGWIRRAAAPPVPER